MKPADLIQSLQEQQQVLPEVCGGHGLRREQLRHLLAKHVDFALNLLHLLGRWKRARQGLRRRARDGSGSRRALLPAAGHILDSAGEIDGYFLPRKSAQQRAAVSGAYAIGARAVCTCSRGRTCAQCDAMRLSTGASMKGAPPFSTNSCRNSHHLWYILSIFKARSGSCRCGYCARRRMTSW